jgi:hypothetical protein
MAGVNSSSPVFIVGTLRSGASLLSLALGQHPQVQQVLQNAWVEEFTIGLIRSFRAASRSKALSQIDINGIELDAFFARFGNAALSMMGPNATSQPILLDSTPANLFLITPLRLLFPSARFIHVVRDANEVVASLTNKQLAAVYKSRYIECSVEEARAHWVQGVRAGMDAERAFGSSIVHRVSRQSLVANPAATLESCFAWLDLEFDRAALRPFSSITEQESSKPILADAEINELNRELLQPGVTTPGDKTIQAVLEGDVWRRAMRNERLVPRIPGNAEPPQKRRRQKPIETKSLMNRLIGRFVQDDVSSRRGSS